MRLLIRSGVTFPVLEKLLRELYVSVAEHEFTLVGKEQTDSRVSLLSGVHRKEVARLRGAGAPVSSVPTSVSRFGQIIARWLGEAEYRDESGQPRALPKSSAGEREASFESLVESVTRDVRPRAVLDEWLSQGLVSLDGEQRVTLSQAAFLPREDGDALAYYFGRNLHDHIAAAAANLNGVKPRFMERAVHYDGLTEAQAAKLEAFSRSLASQALLDANATARDEIRAPASGDQAAEWRWSFGVYVYREKRVSEGKGE